MTHLIKFLKVRLKPEEYLSISRIKNEASIPLVKGGRPKDFSSKAG
jgi:hypothetical protein